MNNYLKTYKQRQFSLFANLLISLAFIYQNIHLLVSEQELVPKLLCTFSFIVFLFLAVLCTKKLIFNYKSQS